jgi:hypothetical protein
MVCFFYDYSFGVYFIDANLNFPIARPQVLAPWALTMALLTYYYHKAKKTQKKATPKKVKALTFFPLLAIVLMIPSYRYHPYHLSVT